MSLATRCTLAVLCLFGAMPTALGAARPNIIVILADDMGFSDLGCYGGEIRTPHLDQLAANGLRWTQFYNTARCCPTRACLLTGLYPHQAGMGHMVQDHGFDSYRGDLNRRCVTLAESLKPAGYRAYAVGKWHVTKGVAVDGPKDNWPLQRGFDRFYGTITGAGSYYDPATLVRDNTMLSAFADKDYQPKTYYYTDAISDHAVRYLGEHAKEQKDKPFVMYVAYTAAHWPMHALPEDIARYKGKYDGGYEPVRKARFERAIQLGLIDPKQPLTPQAESWDKVADKQWETACMEVYAAMIDRLDQGVGKIVAELKRTGQFDNTLVLFMQDNGGCAETVGRTAKSDHPNIPRPAQPTLPTIAADAIAWNAIIPTQTRDGFPVRMGSKAMPGPADTYIAYGRGWANVSNMPFREYKSNVHEGGISTPLIAHWPNGIATARRGKLEKTPGHLIDILATCIDVGGATYPRKVGVNAIQPLEGISLAAAFSGQPLARTEPLFFEHMGNRAIREGDWKLVANLGGPWELYHLSSDRVETNNLAAKESARVQALAEKWNTWAKRVGVQPWPLKKGKP